MDAAPRARWLLDANATAPAGYGNTARDSDMASFNSVAVIGAGAWGTALACAALRAGRDVVLYRAQRRAAAQMQATRANPQLPACASTPHRHHRRHRAARAPTSS
jgi:threonine dehydrogenase-like Zn-dependent dehydrogenase